MDLRNFIWNDWIDYILLACLVILVISKLFSTVKIENLLSSFLSDRFINISRNQENNSSSLVIGCMIVYTISLSLLLYLYYARQLDQELKLNDFLIVCTCISIFLLSQSYLSKLVATLCDFENLLHVMQHHKNIYRAMLGVFVFILVVICVYAFNFNTTVLKIGLGIIAILLLLYNLTLFYTYRKNWAPVFFYFILYLCALEIAPYLLLYKYIKL